MSMAEPTADEDVAFHADYVYFDNGRSHTVVNEELPVVVDGFDWATRVAPYYGRRARDRLAGAVVGGDIRVQGIVTEVEADGDTHVVHVEPNMGASP